MSQNFLPFPIFFRHIVLGNFHCVLTRLFLRDFSAVKIKKGLDEVKATQWAEKEKLDAKRNAALQVLQSQKEEFQAYLQSGERGLADYYKAAHGFTMDDLRMTPEQLEGFQQARKSMLENILPNFRDPTVIAAEQEEMKRNFRMSVGGKEYSYDEVMGSMNSELQGIRQQMDKLGVHYGYIEKFIERLGERFNIREIAFDR